MGSVIYLYTRTISGQYSGFRVRLGIGNGADLLRYADARRGQSRLIRVQRAGAEVRLQALLLAGDTSAGGWILDLLQREASAQAYGRQLLAPGATPPAALPAREKQVCTCFNVGAPAIQAHLAQCGGTTDERLASLQGALRCGTNCGSCLPELRRLVRETPIQARAEAQAQAA